MGRSKGSPSTKISMKAERLAMAFRPAQFAPSPTQSREIFSSALLSLSDGSQKIKYGFEMQRSVAG